MCKSIRVAHKPKQVRTDAAEKLEKGTTVEPPESDHPKCEDLAVAYGRRSLTRTEPQEVYFEKKTGHIYFKPFSPEPPVFAGADPRPFYPL